MLFNVGIENLPERYSTQWNEWFPREFEKLKIPYVDILGNSLTDKIETGKFLDVFNTNYYKLSQLQILIKGLRAGEIKDGDIIFFHDLWFPSLEVLAYIRNATGIKFKIAGIFHAGLWDSNDFLSQKGMGYWGELLENSWFRIIDFIFVATEYHKNLILQNRDCDKEKIFVTGLPIYANDYPTYSAIKKENIIVFPHRLDFEKQPDIFDEIRKDLRFKVYSDWKFIKSKDVCETKNDYYQLLTRSKIAVSCSLQETFGISMQEALFYGCLPLVPDRLSYSELYLDDFKYKDYEHFKKKIFNFMEHFSEKEKLLELQKDILAHNGVMAIPKMMRALRLLK